MSNQQENRVTITINLHREVLKELEYLVALHRQHGAPAQMDSIESLVNYVLVSIADGSRRPGSWERQLLESLGLVADCAEHRVYRDRYGP
ncbi:hypothetical protein [uncultured Paraglaciecola sp.]|uniref:hypothetical protein n=1 Tax=uncultured Paraglaciecola sp. TaxID=1765024 RepID=UPI00260A3E6F|nr:hypothetical protein [uncultured Paraglaciecola sp.]